MDKTMQEFSGNRAVKVLEWAFAVLSDIDQEELTQFERELLARLAQPGTTPDEEEG